MKTKRRLSKKEIEKKYHESASHPRRLIAYAIDWYLTSVLAMAPVIFFCSVETGKEVLTVDISLLSKNHAIIAFIVGLLLCLWYLVYLPNKNGQTFGKKITSIKIEKMDNNPLDYLTLIKRELVGVLLVEGVMFTCSTYFHELIAMILGISYSHYIAYAFTVVLVISIVLAIIKPEKRMIHDYIANTKVILVKK
ncbi:MAG: RDD family protein [Bacilli bacterium]|nr:RDD family protein [Bacilli bacterium]